MSARRTTCSILSLAAAMTIAAAAHAQGATPPATQATAPAAAPAAVVDSTPKRAPRRSWTSDRRDYAVGDVITVLVDEATLASQDKDNTASESRKKELGFGFSTQSPTSVGGTKIGVNTNNAGTSQQHGESTRQNRFHTEVSVRVVAVSPTGLLQVKGKKMMLVDKNQQEVTLTGWVRPQDISATNLIDGFRVADAELVFNEKGENLAAPKSGLLGRLIGKIWP